MVCPQNGAAVLQGLRKDAALVSRLYTSVYVGTPTDTSCYRTECWLWRAKYYSSEQCLPGAVSYPLFPPHEELAISTRNMISKKFVRAKPTNISMRYSTRSPEKDGKI